MTYEVELRHKSLQYNYRPLTGVTLIKTFLPVFVMFSSEQTKKKPY